MKIYASRKNSKQSELQKYAGKDLWVFATVQGTDCYILINYVTDIYASLYVMDADCINKIHMSYWQDILRWVLDDVIQNDIHNQIIGCGFNLDYIHIFPEDGIYTTQELREMLRSYE